MSGNGRESLPDVREWSGGPHGCPGVARSGREAIPDDGSGPESLPDVREWSRDPSGCPGEVIKTFPDVWEWSGGPPG